MPAERLLVTTRSGAVTLISLESGTPVVRTVPASDALWASWRFGAGEPTWSHASDHAVIQADGVSVPGSYTQPPLFLAPRLPHYFLWSPRGKRLAYVVPDGRSLVLNVWTAGEAAERALVAGAPLFPAWHPGEDVLFVHHGTVLERFDLASGEQMVLSNSAAGFRTPAVAPDGTRVAWAEVRDGAVRVMESNGTQDGLAERGSHLAGVVLSYEPPSRLVVSVGSSPESSSFSEVRRGGEASPFLRGTFVASWASPDGSRLVTLQPSFAGDGRYQPRLWDNRGIAVAATEPFVPSADVSTMVNFFDQYTLSHPAWSASGRWFGMCGRFVAEGPHPAFSDGLSDYVWLWDSETGAVHRRVTPGSTLAFER